MNNPIKVLWLDDEAKDLITDFSQSAKVYNVIIEKHFTNSAEAIKYIRSSEFDLDAVIIDGYFFKNEGSSKKKDITALADTIDELSKLLHRENKKIPFCVFTGYLDEIEHEALLRKVEVFNKGDDNKKMFKYLKSEVATNEEKQIRIQYEEVFSVFNDEYIGSDQAKYLVKILRSIKTNKVYFEDELYFNRLRIILEYLFRAANKFGLLHNACIQGQNRDVIIRLSHRFLSGLRVDSLNIKCSKTHFPVIIQDHVNDIIEITNIASHSESEEKRDSEKNLNEYRKIINTPYLLYSLTFKLMDILLWFKRYVDYNNDVEKNKALWESLDDAENGYWLKGTVINLNAGGFAFLRAAEEEGHPENCFIPESTISTYEIEEGDKIRGLAVPSDKNPIIKQAEILS